MKLKSNLLIALTLFLVTACDKYWVDHYDVYPETVDENVWDAMQNDPEISEFVKILKGIKYDTLFLSDIPYTLFVPSNEALAQYQSANTIDQSLIDYHISSHFVQSGNIVGKRYIQTLATKFVLFEQNGELKLDGIPIIKESPLYKNGKYFVMEQVAKPLPSLYDYFVINNPVLREYIDLQDSFILDRGLSQAIGFDENGNTIFDSVLIAYNEFEDKFFPVSKEFRNQRATIVFPKKDDYEAALTIMAQKLNSPGYNDYSDIPIEWQYNVLVPYILKQGVFENMLEPEEFVWRTPKDTLKLNNIQGDSAVISYTPVEKYTCSNGYAYNYSAYQIPEKLYSGNFKFEAELLLDQTGLGKFAWNKKAKVISGQFFAPSQVYVSGASNDTIVQVGFTKGYNKKFSLEFSSQALFPRKYQMLVRTHMNTGGVYEIYVNDVFVRKFDYYDYTKYKGVLPSVVIPGVRYSPALGFNNFDMLVDITEYGSAKIRFEYIGPGIGILNNGLVIDYVDFVPVVN